jgi:hypothetical protein
VRDAFFNFELAAVHTRHDASSYNFTGRNGMRSSAPSGPGLQEEAVTPIVGVNVVPHDFARRVDS